MLTVVSDGQRVTFVGHLPDDNLIRVGAFVGLVWGLSATPWILSCVPAARRM